MNRWKVGLLCSWLAGCPWVGNKAFEANVQDVDGDGGISIRFGGSDCQDDDPSIVNCDADDDGHLSITSGGADCDDARTDVHPDAPEVCDGRDNDCDGVVDNDDPDVVGDTVFYLDRDGDGAGDPSSSVTCQEAGLHSPNADDCDDTDPAVRPGATELCDGYDNNCDGQTDNVGLWMIDADGDGFGVTGTQTTGSCDLANSTGVAAVGGDCDDTDALVFPFAIETSYDGIDSNCNGGLDDWDADFDLHVPAEHWAAAQAANSQLPADERWPILQGDCDDANPARFVGAPEICDGFDNDCDTLIDSQDLVGAEPTEEPALRMEVGTYYVDGDGDGHFGIAVELCPEEIHPGLHSSVEDDCYDGQVPAPPGFASADPLQVHDGATERCDGVDNDCNGRTDWSFSTFASATPHFLDADRDTYGDAPVFACGPIPTAGVVVDGGDCNDGDPTISPGALEICGDSIRQDCSTFSVWDCDGDGQDGVYIGSPDGEDCNDIDATVFLNPAPGGEICDGIDNDCDHLVDSADTDNLSTGALPVWFPDLDDDTWGNDAGIGVQQCDAPSANASVRRGDCDDDDPTLNPTTVWYADLDGDGFGRGSTTTVSCTVPPGQWATVAGDCNDNDARYHPATRWLPDLDGDFVGDPTGVALFCAPPANEAWVLESEGIDCNDADPAVQFASTWYRDHDGDGFGDTQTIAACSRPSGYVAQAGDCNDLDPTRNPLRDEICNGVDDDCDGSVDDADPNVLAPPGLTGFQDVDGDGVGGSIQKSFCFALPPGWTDQAGDCADDDADVYPGAIELCGNGVDDDCDGSELPPTWYPDADGDGFGVGTAGVEQCTSPPGVYATRTGDCDDTEPTTFPGAPELDSCDTIDSDCDGTPEPRLTWTYDGDDDGYGDDATARAVCVPPSDTPAHSAPGGNWVLTGGDCDDDAANVTFGRIWYNDVDGDGLGNPNSARFECPQYVNGIEIFVWLRTDLNNLGVFDPGDEQLVVVGGDCDDTRAIVGTARAYFVDADGDGWGSTHLPTQVTCPTSQGQAPVGLTTFGGDCADTVGDLPSGTTVDPADVNPAQEDVPDDQVDNDCDGIPDGTAAGIQWYADLDMDGIGGTPLDSYVAPAATSTGDCDDDDADIGRGYFYFADLDDDGFGTGAPTFISGCTAVVGMSTSGGDCNDNAASVYPTAPETCDGIDNNCVNGIDETVSSSGYVDADQDGYGDASRPTPYCGAVPPTGVASLGTDCNDQNAAIHPGQTEACGPDDVDCMPGNEPTVPVWYLDADGDLFGRASVNVTACLQPGTGWIQDDQDCDDTNSLANPDGTESCNGFDDDCDGNVDDAGDEAIAFADFDDDGYANDANQVRLCPGEPLPFGYRIGLIGNDCMDGDPEVNPGRPEICGDSKDNDCDGSIDDQGLFWPDLDGDGTGDGFQPALSQSCATATGVQNQLDCDDSDPARNALLAEVCDGVADNDCSGDGAQPEEKDHDFDLDGFTECQGDPNDQDHTLFPGSGGGGTLFTWYQDLDGDGFGNPGVSLTVAAQPAGYVLNNGDCDDSAVNANPAVPIEFCDGIDNNCDGFLLTDATGTTPDVVNLAAGVGLVDAQFRHFADLDLDGLYSLNSRIDLCNPVQGTGAIFNGLGVTVARVQTLASLGGNPLTLADCEQGGSPTFFGRDDDGDLATTHTDPEDVILDCVGNLAPQGFAPVSLAQDCAPFDFTGRVMAQAGQYPDADGDGAFSPIAVPGPVCVYDQGNTAGIDCNDHAPGAPFDESNEPVLVRSSDELNAALGVCTRATFLLDLDDPAVGLGNRAFNDGVDLTFRSVAGIGDCNEFNLDGCVAGTIAVGSGSRITFEEIGLDLVWNDGQPHPDSEVTFRNVYLRGSTGSTLNSRTRIEDSIFLIEEHAGNPMLRVTEPLTLSNSVVRGTGSGTALQLEHQATLDGLRIHDVTTGIGLYTNHLITIHGLEIHDAEFGVFSVTDSRLELEGAVFDGMTQAVEARDDTRITIRDAEFRNNDRALFARNFAVIECTDCAARSGVTSVADAGDNARITLSDSVFESNNKVADTIGAGSVTIDGAAFIGSGTNHAQQTSRIEVTNASFTGGSRAFEVLHDASVECDDCSFQSAATGPELFWLPDDGLGTSAPTLVIRNSWFGHTHDGYVVRSTDPDSTVSIFDSSTAFGQERGLVETAGHAVLRNVSASKSGPGPEFLAIAQGTLDIDGLVVPEWTVARVIGIGGPGSEVFADDLDLRDIVGVYNGNADAHFQGVTLEGVSDIAFDVTGGHLTVDGLDVSLAPQVVVKGNSALIDIRDAHVVGSPALRLEAGVIADVRDSEFKSASQNAVEIVGGALVTLDRVRVLDAAQKALVVQNTGTFVGVRHSAFVTVDQTVIDVNDATVDLYAVTVRANTGSPLLVAAGNANVTVLGGILDNEDASPGTCVANQAGAGTINLDTVLARDAGQFYSCAVAGLIHEAGMGSMLTPNYTFNWIPTNPAVRPYYGEFANP